MNTSVQQQLQEMFLQSTGVTTDSRKVAEGNIFIALRGENFDGNEYAAKALEDGAMCAVVEKESRFGKEVSAGVSSDSVIQSRAESSAADRYTDGDSSCGHAVKRYLLVDDTLKALQELARWYRLRFDIPVIALTGTNGKTTTKELLNAVLSRKFRVTATTGNLNNHIGVPLTLLKINSETQVAVIEMGASAPGEIRTLVEIANPTCGLVTNVGKAHLLGFGSFEGVKKTKGELYDYLFREGRQVFYNADSADLCEMISDREMAGAAIPAVDLPAIRYGLNYSGTQVLPVTGTEPFLRIRLGDKHSSSGKSLSGEAVISTHLIGAYNADNVLAALCVGEYFGISSSDMKEAIGGYYPSNSRSELKQTGHNLLVVDAYNANPTSMITALRNYESSEFEHKMVILGDMRELGAESSDEHATILRFVHSMSLDNAYFVGDEFIAAGKSSGPSSKAPFLFFHTADELKAYLSDHPLSGRTILLKGSNGTKLQSLVDFL